MRVLLDTKEAKRSLTLLRYEYMALSNVVATQTNVMRNVLKASVVAMGGLAASFVGLSMAVKDYNKALTDLKALGDLTDQQVDILNKRILDLGVTMGYSTDSIAAGALELAKAGLAFQDIYKILEVLVQVAKANNMTFEEAGTLAVYFMTAFHMTTEEVVKAMDELQVAAKSTPMNFAEFVDMLRFAAASADMSKIGYERLVAVMATLSKAGLRAGLSARAINQMFLQMVRNLDDLQAWVDAMGLGIEIVKDGKINFDELIETLGNMNKDIEFLQQSMEIFNVRSSRAWLMLVNNAQEYFDLLEKMKGAQGTLRRTAEIQMTSIASLFTQVKEAFFAVLKQPENMHRITEAVNNLVTNLRESGALQNLADILIGLFDVFAERGPQLIGLFGGLTDLLKTLIPISVALGDTFTHIVRTFEKLPEPLQQMLIYFSMLKRLGIGTYITDISRGFITYYAIQEAAIPLEIKSIYLMNTKLQLMSRLAQAAGMMGFSLYMLVTASSKAERVLWLLVTALNAATLAFSLYAVAKSAAFTAPVGGVGGIMTAGNIALGSAMVAGSLTPIFMYQRGIEFVPEERIAILHRGERVVRKDQPLGAGEGGGIVIDMRGAYVLDPERFVEIVEKELRKKWSVSILR